MEVEYRDRRDWVSGRRDNTAVSFRELASSSADAKELRDNLDRAHKKPLRTVLDGHVYILKVRITESFGEDTFAVSIEPAPKLDPTAAPRFTKKQGQYLAFLYSYAKIHRTAPSEVDLQGFFQVSAPSVHEMINPGTERLNRTNARAGSIHTTSGPAGTLAATDIGSETFR